jgi:hypothetical protein
MADQEDIDEELRRKAADAVPDFNKEPPFLCETMMEKYNHVSEQYRKSFIERNELRTGVYAYEGKSKNLVKLLHNRTPCDRMNDRGLTPLCLACRNGHLECARALVGKKELGNDINQADDDGVTPFAYACRAGHLEIAMMLATVPEMDPTVANKHLESVRAPPSPEFCPAHSVLIYHLPSAL